MILLFLLGVVVAYFTSSTDTIEFFSTGGKGVEGDFPKTGVYLGTVILVGLGLLISVFNATSEIPRDINSRLISVLLSKPLSRFHYVVGKFIGTIVVSMTFSLSWVAVLLISRSFAVDASPSSIQATLAQLLCVLSLIPACAFATAVSCFFSDMVSMIITSAYVFISFAMAITPIIATLSGAIFGKIVLFIYYLFPNFMFYFQNTGSLASLLGLVLYSFSLSLIFIIMGVARFNEGDVFTRG